MSKIKWDEVGERLYETGVDRGVLYLYDSTSGKFTNGEAWNGLSAVNESPSGAEASPIYADNIKYLNLMSAEQYGATIEAYTYPDAFEECDGSVTIAEGVTARQQTRKLFGFCYRTLIGNDVDGTDHGYRLHLVYNCLASPSGRDHSTVNDSPEATTMSWEISTTPMSFTGDTYKPTAVIEIDSTKCDPDDLTALEALLYGTDASGGNEATVPTLPTPDKIVELFT